MDGKVDGLIARQVSVDRDRNTVVVWVTFDRKESLYDDFVYPHRFCCYGRGSWLGLG